MILCGAGALEEFTRLPLGSPKNLLFERETGPVSKGGHHVGYSSSSFYYIYVVIIFSRSVVVSVFIV